MKRKLLKSIVSSFTLQIVILICGFIVPNLIIKYYGSEINGLVVSITQFLSYISLFEAGVGPVIKSMLYKPIANNDINQIKNILYTSEKFFRRLSIMFIFYIIIMIIIYPLFLNGGYSTITTILLIVVISISILAEYFFGITYMIFLQAQQESYVISYAQIFVRILSTFIMVILILNNESIIIVKLLSSLILILKPIIQNYYVKKKYNIFFKNANEIDIPNRWDAFAQHIAYIIHTNTDTIVLTVFSSIKNVSIYSIYLLIINGIRNLIGSLCSGLEAGFGDMIAKKEKKKLLKVFDNYKYIYFLINTVVFSCTFILTIPFVKVYTKGITDANYIQNILAILLITSEVLYSIRRPFNSLVLAAGKFKETKKGAWIEAITNISLSIILVIKYGLIGVAIGTVFSMLVRTIELIIYTHKNILDYSYKKLVKEIIIFFTSICLSYNICNFVNDIIFLKINNYMDLVIIAFIDLLICTIIAFLLNVLFNKTKISIKDILKGVDKHD